MGQGIKYLIDCVVDLIFNLLTTSLWYLFRIIKLIVIITWEVKKRILKHTSIVGKVLKKVVWEQKTRKFIFIIVFVLKNISTKVYRKTQNKYITKRTTK